MDKKKFPRGVTQFVIFLAITGSGALFFLMIYNLVSPDQQTWYAALSLAYFIPPAGKETVIIVGLNRGLPLLHWCLTLWVFDALVCIAIMTNWWILETLIAHIPSFPFPGLQKTKPHIIITPISVRAWYDALHQKTQEIQERKYGHLLPFVLIFFMFIPFQGSGAMATTIIGTTLGLRKDMIFFIVTTGSLVSILFISLVFMGIFRL